MNQQDIGARIKETRIAKGYTVEAISEKIGITPRFQNAIEKGVKGLSLQTLESTCTVLGVSYDYILLGSNRDNKNEKLVPIIEMLENLPDDKIDKAIDLLKVFLIAIE